MQRAAYKLPRFRFNTCTDFEYCLLNRLVWLCMIVGLNCGSLPGKVLFHKVIKDEDIHYRSKVWGHPDNFVSSMKTHFYLSNVLKIE